jgi:hypothetical protein
LAEIFSWLALIFLTLAGYSAGAVLGFRAKAVKHGCDTSPSLLDTGIVIVLWFGGIASRLAGMKPWSAVGTWGGIALAVAFVLSIVQPQIDKGKPLPQ